MDELRKLRNQLGKFLVIIEVRKHYLPEISWRDDRMIHEMYWKADELVGDILIMENKLK